MGRLVALLVTVGTIGYTPNCYQGGNVGSGEQ